MKAARHSIIIGLLVLIASLVKGSHDYAFIGPKKDLSGITSLNAVRQYAPGSPHFIAKLAENQSPDHAKHGEKRHGKSLVSQAIVADCPIVLHPDFAYCHRNYSLFLPGGCSRQFFGNFSLRGPPVC